MKESVTFVSLLLLIYISSNHGFPIGSYETVRNEILEYEKQLAFGANLTLSDAEEAANKVLMEAKKSEFKAAFQNPHLYAPGRNFLTAKADIEKSEVFQKILRMPKGAVLHSHDTAIVSTDYVYHNITFRDNLYVCDVDGKLRLQFFNVPDTQCDWELLRDVREDTKRAGDVNKRIWDQLTMVCENPSMVYTDVNKAWTKFVNIFAFITPMLTYKPVYEAHFLRGLQELYEDNVMYLELRSTLPTLYDLNGTTYNERDVVATYLELTERFKKDHPDFIGVKIIYAPSRTVNHKTARQYVKTMVQLLTEFPNFVAGFDLVGQEDKGHTLKYFAEIMAEADPSINFFFHAAETNWYGMSTDENLVDAIILNTRRIGHGYALSYHPFLLEVVKRMNIAVEVNPISNQVLSLVGDLRNHAARRLFAEDYPVVISNDDPGLWGARALSYDFYEAFMGLMSHHSDLRSLKLLAKNSLTFSAMSDAEKQHAFSVWEKKWNTFVNALANKEF